MGQNRSKIVDPLTNEDIEPLIANSDGGGIEVLTIATNVANGASQACRSVILWTDGSDVTMKIGTGAADANDFLLLANVYLPVPVNNTNLLRFYGGTDGKKIYLQYRN